MSIQMLAFNTTTSLCSAALMIGDDVYHYSTMVLNNHSKEILPMINQLLIDSGTTLNALDCVIFDCGPGSFAGVRIGIGIAQGLALGLDLPLIGISSLVILAQAARRLFSASQVIATIDARMDELYWANYYYQTMDDLWICKYGELLVTELIVKKLINSLKGSWVLVGTGWNNYSVLKYISDVNNPIILRSILFPEAQDMLPLGMRSWIKKIFIAPTKVRPVYLRDMVVSVKYKCTN